MIIVLWEPEKVLAPQALRCAEPFGGRHPSLSRSGLGQYGPCLGSSNLVQSPGALTVTTTMEGPLKELGKLESLTSEPSKSKSPSIQTSLDSLLASLKETKNAIAAGGVDPGRLQALAQTVETRKKDIEDKQKEVYSSMARFGKAWDKVRGCYTLELSVGVKVRYLFRNSLRHYRRIRSCSLRRLLQLRWKGQ